MTSSDPLTTAIARRMLAAQQHAERLDPTVVPPAWMYDAAHDIAVWITGDVDRDIIIEALT